MRLSSGNFEVDFETARQQVLDRVRPLAAEWCALADGLDAVAAEDICAAVDAPSVPSALKDGYALRSGDLAGASPQHPVRLALAGTAVAGATERIRLPPLGAVRILTGGGIPRGADAVVPEEFAPLTDRGLLVAQAVRAGSDILPQGADTAVGDLVVRAGEVLTPARLGLLAAAGHSRVRVFRRPRIAVIATGDEVRPPGATLEPGQVYASNAVTLDAWCRRWRCETTMAVVPDHVEALLDALRGAAAACDVVLTSGGAWTGERDLVAPALEALEWRTVFRRVRMLPGKGSGMGLVGRCPVFLLPGGPPGNLAGFLQLALPAIFKIGGCLQTDLPLQVVRLKEAIRGRPMAARIVFGRLRIDGNGRTWFQANAQASRLKALAQAEALLTVPEGVAQMAAGARATVRRLA